MIGLYKFLMLMLLIVFHMHLMALQLDEERALQLLFEIKHGVNRSVHAAAQQVDEDMLAGGIIAIDEIRAKETALHYLRANLRLNEHNAPLPGSLLHHPVEVLVMEVINSDKSFPYSYVNAEYDYEVTLFQPGVIMIIRAEYPRIFHIIDPINWTVKGTAELYRP